jgi:hypothetical protein
MGSTPQHLNPRTKRVLLLVNDRGIRVINAASGELLRTLTLGLARNCPPISTPTTTRPRPSGSGSQ